MLLLLTILLVLIAAITLVIGIFSDQLALIWVSIAASFAAALVLAVVSQMSKRRAQADAAAPVPAAPSPTAPASEAATVADVPPGEPTAVVPVVAGSGGFPIDNYDELKVSEIIPKLDGLSLDELEMVAVYEEDNKNRTTVLSRIDDLMDELEGAEAPTTVAETAAADEAPEAAASAGELPIDDYDNRSVSDIVPALESLDADELEAVAVYEERNKNRVTVLNAIDDRLDILEGVVPDPQPAAKKTASKKSPAKKAAAKKSPAKKSAAKKAAAKKSPAKKAAAKKSPAKKSAAKKTAASKTAKKATKKSTKKR